MAQEEKELMIKTLTQEEKELLIKDLCARLPYGVKLQNVNNAESIVKLRSIDLDGYCCEILFYTYQGKALTICDKSNLFRFGHILRYKPYLFPLSSMTEKQKIELTCIIDSDYAKIDWYIKNHFDYRGLIPMGLAIDATDKNIY